MKHSEYINKIAPALLNAQKKIGAATKGSVNPFFHSKYADLGAVMEACKDELNDNGISVLQPIGTNEHKVYVETVLLHESGEWISESMEIAPKSETNPQEQGSAISYARRYSLQSMVFIPAEDDDAEKATHTQLPTKKPTASRVASPRRINTVDETKEALAMFDGNLPTDDEVVVAYKDDKGEIARDSRGFTACVGLEGVPCGQGVSRQVEKYSLEKYGRVLCYKHQLAFARKDYHGTN